MQILNNYIDIYNHIRTIIDVIDVMWWRLMNCLGAFQVNFGIKSIFGIDYGMFSRPSFFKLPNVMAIQNSCRKNFITDCDWTFNSHKFLKVKLIEYRVMGTMVGHP